MGLDGLSGEVGPAWCMRARSTVGPWVSRGTILLRDGTTYRDIGPTSFDQINHKHVERRLVHRLHDLGYRVTFQPLAAD